MSDSVRPHRWQPTRLPRPWDSPGKNTGVGCHFLLQCLKVKSESEAAQSFPTPSDPMTAAYQAPPSMGFSKQEHWSGVPLPMYRNGLNVFCSWMLPDSLERRLMPGSGHYLLSLHNGISEKEVIGFPDFLKGNLNVHEFYQPVLL